MDFLCDVLNVDCDGLTIKRITTTVDETKRMVTKVCEKMPYDDADADNWERFEIQCMDNSTQKGQFPVQSLHGSATKRLKIIVSILNLVFRLVQDL